MAFVELWLPQGKQREWYSDREECKRRNPWLCLRSKTTMTIRVLSIPNTMNFAARNVDLGTIRRSFLSVISVIEGIICFASDPFSFLCPKSLGFVPPALSTRSSKVHSWGLSFFSIFFWGDFRDNDTCIGFGLSCVYFVQFICLEDGYLCKVAQHYCLIHGFLGFVPFPLQFAFIFYFIFLGCLLILWTSY